MANEDLNLSSEIVPNRKVYWNVYIGQNQCWRLPHEWGLGNGKTEASLPPQNLQRGCFEPTTWWLSETALTTAPGLPFLDCLHWHTKCHYINQSFVHIIANAQWWRDNKRSSLWKRYLFKLIPDFLNSLPNFFPHYIIQYISSPITNWVILSDCNIRGIVNFSSCLQIQVSNLNTEWKLWNLAETINYTAFILISAMERVRTPRLVISNWRMALQKSR